MTVFDMNSCMTCWGTGYISHGNCCGFMQVCHICHGTGRLPPWEIETNSEEQWPPAWMGW